MQRRLLILACATWGLMGCTSTTAHLLIPEDGWVQGADLSALLAVHPLASGENISATLLGRSAALSYHLIQIRDRERSHLHASHDLSVALLRGRGQLFIKGRPHDMHAGDVAVVPRGTRHYFVNTDSAPAVAFATFAPPYDGTDQVFIGE